HARRRRAPARPALPGVVAVRRSPPLRSPGGRGVLRSEHQLRPGAATTANDTM
ncbi:MAG: hypothetical protein AVDCRST_MAG18-3056, partial [uncultured Thermomicrobiales bacterium]